MTKRHLASYLEKHCVMRKYTRLSESGSVNDGALPEFSPPFATEYELNPTNRWGKVVCVYMSSAAVVSKALRSCDVCP